MRLPYRCLLLTTLIAVLLVTGCRRQPNPTESPSEGTPETGEDEAETIPTIEIPPTPTLSPAQIAEREASVETQRAVIATLAGQARLPGGDATVFIGPECVLASLPEQGMIASCQGASPHDINIELTAPGELTIRAGRGSARQTWTLHQLDDPFLFQSAPVPSGDTTQELIARVSESNLELTLVIHLADGQVIQAVGLYDPWTVALAPLLAAEPGPALIMAWLAGMDDLGLPGAGHAPTVEVGETLIGLADGQPAGYRGPVCSAFTMPEGDPLCRCTGDVTIETILTLDEAGGLVALTSNGVQPTQAQYLPTGPGQWLAQRFEPGAIIIQSLTLTEDAIEITTLVLQTDSGAQVTCGPAAYTRLAEPPSLDTLDGVGGFQVGAASLSGIQAGLAEEREYRGTFFSAIEPTTGGEPDENGCYTVENDMIALSLLTQPDGSLVMSLLNRAGDLLFYLLSSPDSFTRTGSSDEAQIIDELQLTAEGIVRVQAAIFSDGRSVTCESLYTP